MVKFIRDPTTLLLLLFLQVSRQDISSVVNVHFVRPSVLNSGTARSFQSDHTSQTSLQSYPERLAITIPIMGNGATELNLTLSRQSSVLSDEETKDVPSALQASCLYDVTFVSTEYSELSKENSRIGELSLCNRGMRGKLHLPVSADFPFGLDVQIEPDTDADASTAVDLKDDLEAIHRITLIPRSDHTHNGILSNKGLHNGNGKMIEPDTPPHSRVRRAAPSSPVSHSNEKQAEPHPLRITHNPTDQERYTVELYLIVEQLLTNALDNRTDIVVRMVNLLMARVNAIYAIFNIRFVVVRLEIWAIDQAAMAGTSHEILASLGQYKRTLTRVRHDCMHALLLDFRRSSLPKGEGKARTMCTFSECVGYTLLNVKAPRSSEPTIYYDDAARTMAHELGHNFGLKHDTEKCICQSCIMVTGAEVRQSSFQWSSCSIRDMKPLLKSGMGSCLHDLPCESTYTVHDYVDRRKYSARIREVPVTNRTCQMDEPDSPQPELINFCGNGILDPGEECDCGTSLSCPKELQQCCDVERCTLRKPSTCGGGPCCQVHKVGEDANGNSRYQCSFAPAGTTCRAVSGTCDLPEYCDGSTAHCPADLYKADGTVCYTEYGYKAYCIRGGCRESNTWCRALWTQSSSIGHSRCFSENKSPRMAEKLANCGMQRSIPRSRFYSVKSWKGIACHESADAECGRLWCHARGERSRMLGFADMETISLDSNQQSCVALLYDPTWPISDPATMDSTGIRQRNFDAAGSGFRSGVTQDAGMVPDGSPCSKGMCYNGSCVPIATIQSKTTCSCVGPHDCNNLGQCHCSPGFRPPRCEFGGYGGSLSSGPPPEGQQLSSGTVGLLLTVFFIIIPLIVFSVYFGVYHRCQWRSFIANPIPCNTSGWFSCPKWNAMKRFPRSFKSQGLSRVNENGHSGKRAGGGPLLMFGTDYAQNGTTLIGAPLTAHNTKTSPVLPIALGKSPIPKTKGQPPTPPNRRAHIQFHTTKSNTQTPHSMDKPISKPVSDICKRVASIRSTFLHRQQSGDETQGTTIPTPSLQVSKPQLESTTFVGRTLPLPQAGRILNHSSPFRYRDPPV